VIERAKLLDLSAVRLGTVGADSLTIKTPGKELSWKIAELHDLWWNAIARAMAR
jgi:hypothetical protein